MTGVERIRNAFAAAAAASRTAFIGYFTAGYPTLDDTPLLLKSAADAGVDLIELGVAFSDPVADGATIQNVCTGPCAARGEGRPPAPRAPRALWPRC